MDSSCAMVDSSRDGVGASRAVGDTSRDGIDASRAAVVSSRGDAGEGVEGGSRREQGNGAEMTGEAGERRVSADVVSARSGDAGRSVSDGLRGQSWADVAAARNNVQAGRANAVPLPTFLSGGRVPIVSGVLFLHKRRYNTSINNAFDGLTSN